MNRIFPPSLSAIVLPSLSSIVLLSLSAIVPPYLSAIVPHPSVQSSSHPSVQSSSHSSVQLSSIPQCNRPPIPQCNRPPIPQCNCPPIPQCNCPEGRNATDCFSTLITKFFKAWRMITEKEATMEKTQFNLRDFKRNIPHITFEFFQTSTLNYLMQESNAKLLFSFVQS